MGAAIAVMDAEIAELKNALEREKDGGFDLSSLMSDQKRLLHELPDCKAHCVGSGERRKDVAAGSL